jgi:hypothetical protein
MFEISEPASLFRLGDAIQNADDLQQNFRTLSTMIPNFLFKGSSLNKILLPLSVLGISS